MRKLPRTFEGSRTLALQISAFEVAGTRDRRLIKIAGFLVRVLIPPAVGGSEASQCLSGPHAAASKLPSTFKSCLVGPLEAIRRRCGGWRFGFRHLAISFRRVVFWLRHLAIRLSFGGWRFGVDISRFGFVPADGVLALAYATGFVSAFLTFSTFLTFRRPWRS